VVECQLPKLDVAGSTPVSRSNFSITYKHHRTGWLQLAPIHMILRAASSLLTASLRRSSEVLV
jgi:hypothetical protein